MIRQSPGESETALRLGGRAPFLSPGAGRRPTAPLEKEVDAGENEGCGPPALDPGSDLTVAVAGRSDLPTLGDSAGHLLSEDFRYRQVLPMNLLRPGEGLRPDAAGPLFLALARSNPFFLGTESLPLPRDAPGRDGCRNR